MAEHEKSKNRLQLTFDGQAFPNGQVPVGVLAAKLQALQNLLYHAAATVSNDARERKGLWVNRYVDVAELKFTGTQIGSLVVQAELREPGLLFDDEQNIGKESVELIFRVAEAVTKNSGALDQLNLNRDDQGYLLRAIENLCPSSSDYYTVELQDPAVPEQRRVTFDYPTRCVVRRLAAQPGGPLEEEPVTIVGDLTKIHVGVAPEKIAVRVPRAREIECFYTPSMRDQITNLLAGSTVEVTGPPSRDSKGRIVKLNNIQNVEPVNMEPLRLSQFEYEGKRYRLREPLTVTVEFVDKMWIYHNDAVNLWGTGVRREEALLDLQGNFDYLFREFAEEKESALDAKARQIKQKLLSIVV